MPQSPTPSQFAAPPRTIDTGLVVRMMLGSGRSQIGWLVLAIGSILFWVVIRHGDLSAWRFQLGRVGQTTGKFISCTETGFAVSQGRRRPPIPILRYRFEYEIMGRMFEGFSFAKAPCQGGTFAVEYLMGQPEVSRIVGMRRQIFSQWTVLTAAVPLVGLWLILSAAMEGRRRVRLLRDGLITKARLIDKAWTNIRSGSSQVYRMTFEYTAQNGATGSLSTRTNEPKKLEGAAGVPVFYDPAGNLGAVLLPSLPGAIAADAAGQPVARRSSAFLFIPAVTLLWNAWYAYHNWMAGRNLY